VNAGVLKNLVSLERYTTIKSDCGEVIKGWSELITLWCSISPITGKEYFDNKQMQGEISHKIKCRYYDDITIKDRIVFKTRIFKIVSILNINERDVSLEIMCKEEV